MVVDVVDDELSSLEIVVAGEFGGVERGGEFSFGGMESFARTSKSSSPPTLYAFPSISSIVRPKDCQAATFRRGILVSCLALQGGATQRLGMIVVDGVDDVVF
jgi:hypothetical protein